MAKNYRNSDYALNKYSDGIVYRFADRIIEVTLVDYLTENPDKTEQDFLELKALSDEIYHQQVVDENRTCRLDVTLNDWADSEQLATLSLETEVIECEDQQFASKALRYALQSGVLTEVQLRKFTLYFVDGLSQREIANLEYVTHHAVALSLGYAVKKIEEFFK